jgi:hypothetical protein
MGQPPAEFLYFENSALKAMVMGSRIPHWERHLTELLSDPKLNSQIRAKFQHLYDEIEHARDESKALEELLQALPKPKKDWN